MELYFLKCINVLFLLTVPQLDPLIPTSPDPNSSDPDEFQRVIVRHGISDFRKIIIDNHEYIRLTENPYHRRNLWMCAKHNENKCKTYTYLNLRRREILLNKNTMHSHEPMVEGSYSSSDMVYKFKIVDFLKK